MIKKLTTWFFGLVRAFFINLGTVAVSFPLLVICLLLNLTVTFWLYNLLDPNTAVQQLSGRLILALFLPGCLGSLALNGFVIYRLSRYLEERYKEN